jgi:hypothetical protein
MSNRFVETVGVGAVEVAGGHTASLRLRSSPALLDPPANILNPLLFPTADVAGVAGKCCVLSVRHAPSSSFAFAFFARFESNILWMVPEGSEIIDSDVIYKTDSPFEPENRNPTPVRGPPISSCLLLSNF